MALEYSKLRGRIVEKYKTLGAFSSELGTTLNTVSRKINGEVAFSQEDILKWSEKLDIPNDQLGVYFFALKV